MSNFFQEARITLVIRGAELDTDLLTQSMKINPTCIYKYNAKEGGEELDAWYFSTKYERLEKLDTLMQEFLDKIKHISSTLETVPDISCEFDLHVHSELAQIYFELPQSVTWQLLQFGFPFGISVLSWGGVEDT